MTDYTIYINWPALTPDNDGDSADELEEWMEDPFKRRILYSFYVISELIKIAVVSVSIVAGTATLLLIEPAIAAELGMFWTAITVGLAVIISDIATNKPITKVSMIVTYYLFLTIGHAYFKYKGVRNRKPDIQEETFTRYVDLFPVFDFLKRKSGENLQKRERKRLF